ncbi:MAG: DUF2911 domain-containing protein [Acidobacteriota bacterium]|nr:DUF2911 domain-containing protein [Acidobacteriota bacterium]
MTIRNGILRSFTIAVSAALFCLVLAPRARAGEWNERTLMTFSQPVEVPGRVLPAGTYDFQLANLASNRDVVLIFNKDRTRLYDIVMGQAAYRVHPTGKTVVTFSERPVGSPMAVNKWFYPGNHYGLRFVYPHSQVQMAMAKSGNRSRTS